MVYEFNRSFTTRVFKYGKKKIALDLLREPFAPGWGKVFDPQGALAQIVEVRFVQIQAHGVGNGDAVLIRVASDDCVSRTHFTFAEHPEIKAAAAAGQKALGHVVAFEPQIQLEARNARLRYNHLRCANRETISQVDVILQQAGCREVFAEGAPG